MLAAVFVSQRILVEGFNRLVDYDFQVLESVYQ